MAFSEFLITDGTTSIDFLTLNRRGSGGVGMTRYTPGRPNLKGGGIWQDSPLAVGRRMVYGTKANINDAIEFYIGHSNHTALIEIQQNLDSLLEKAIAYWITDWADEPVYIKARAAGESSPRYAIIYSAEFPSYPDPYSQPYTGNTKKFVMEGIVLGIERGQWMDHPPGSGTEVLVGHQYAPVNDSIAYVRNVYLPGPSSNDILRKAFNGANVVSASNLPLTLFGTGAANQFFMFGVGYPGVIANFYTLVFNIGTAFASSAHVIIWEYSIGTTGSSDGTDWGDLAPYMLYDGTNEFRNTGINTVSWSKPTVGSWVSPNWTTYTQNNGLLWVRARVVSSSGVTSVPIQITNPIYTPKTPYIDIDNVEGDLSALASVRLLINTVADNYNVDVHEVLLGLRSLDRGEDFNAYLNASTYNAGLQPAGIGLVYGAGVVASSDLQNMPYASRHAAILPTLDPVPADFEEFLYYRLAPEIASQYYGTYRIFMRAGFAGPPAPRMRYRIGYEGGTFYTGTTVTGTVYNNTDLQAIGGTVHDLGTIRIPPTSVVRPSDPSSAIILAIDTISAQTIIRDVILMPTDEWNASLSGTTPNETGIYLLDIDSIGNPKERLRGVLRADDETVIDTFMIITSASATLSANTGQRLWVFARDDSENPHVTLGVSIDANARFHHLRSD